MEDRRKFLKNRGGLLQKAANTSANQSTQLPNSGPPANPFFQELLQSQPQSSPNLSQPTQSRLSSAQSLPKNSGQHHVQYQFDFSREELAELNSSPENVRFTSSMFPPLDKVESLRLPVGCHVRPWFNAGESISMVDFFQLYREKTGSAPPKKFDIPRCKSCRAYVNGFFKFLEHGRKMQCNLCLLVQDVPSYYVAPLDERGRRIDLGSR